MGVKSLQADVARTTLLFRIRLQGAHPRQKARARLLEHQTSTAGVTHGRITSGSAAAVTSSATA